MRANWYVRSTWPILVMIIFTNLTPCTWFVVVCNNCVPFCPPLKMVYFLFSNTFWLHIVWLCSLVCLLFSLPYFLLLVFTNGETNINKHYLFSKWQFGNGFLNRQLGHFETTSTKANSLLFYDMYICKCSHYTTTTIFIYTALFKTELQSALKS